MAVAATDTVSGAISCAARRMKASQRVNSIDASEYYVNFERPTAFSLETWPSTAVTCSGAVETGRRLLCRIGLFCNTSFHALKSSPSNSKPGATNSFNNEAKMFLNPFNTEEALPLRQRRKWRDPRCDAYAMSEANIRLHIGASCDAHFDANSNAMPSALFAANKCAASMPSSI